MHYEDFVRKLHKRYFYLSVLVWLAAVLVAAGYTGLKYYKQQIAVQYDNLGRASAATIVSKTPGGVTQGASTTTQSNQTSETSVSQTSIRSNSMTQVISKTSSNVSLAPVTASNDTGSTSAGSANPPSSATTPRSSNTSQSGSATPAPASKVVSTCILILCVGL